MDGPPLLELTLARFLAGAGAAGEGTVIEGHAVVAPADFLGDRLGTTFSGAVVRTSFFNRVTKDEEVVADFATRTTVDFVVGADLDFDFDDEGAEEATLVPVKGWTFSLSSTGARRAFLSLILTTEDECVAPLGFGSAGTSTKIWNWRAAVVERVTRDMMWRHWGRLLVMAPRVVVERRFLEEEDGSSDDGERRATRGVDEEAQG